jgi:hypothetical protein
MSLGHRLPLHVRRARQPPRPPAEKPVPIYRSHVDRLLSGPHGGRTRRLLSFLQDMTLADGRALVDHITTEGWLDEADREARADALSLIGVRITHLRERAGLAPFDDPLPGSPRNVFLVIRKLLGGA